MSNKITGPKPPSTGAIRPGGGGNIRPLYGVIIRDDLNKFKNQIGVTLSDTKKAIKAGDPKGPEIMGDGVLQGSELKKAKAAVKDLEKALKALGPVFPGIKTPVPKDTAPRDMGRPVGPGPIAMYGVIFRDDLSKFRTEIGGNIREIRTALNNGVIKKDDQPEAKKALKYLEAALKDLGSAGAAWPR